MKLLSSHVRRAAVAAGVLILVPLGVAAPAHGASADIRDARDDMGHKADIQRVRVVHQARVRVLVHHRDLTRQGKKGAAVFLDTDRRDRGPEYAFVGGIFEGTDYALLKVKGWNTRDGRRVNCQHDLQLRYAREVSEFRIGRGCLGRPAAVRVAVRVTAERVGGGWANDWLKGRRHLTRAVPFG